MKCSLELKSLEELRFNLDLLGFDDNELAALLEPDQVGRLTDEGMFVPDVPGYQLRLKAMCGFWATIA